MKTLLLRMEPIIWLLFGNGILIGTMLLTAWLLVVGVGIPLGIFPDSALAYDRAHMLGSNLIGRLVLAALIALPLWKGAHHIRSLSIDFGGHSRDTLVAVIVYGIADIGTLLAIWAVFRI